MGSIYRAGSVGSTGTSPNTPTPSSGLASSDYGEEKIEQRKLLKPVESEIENNPFAFGPAQLAKLHDPKDLNVLRQMGGLEGLALGLRTDIATGLSKDEDHLTGQVKIQDIWHELETRRKQRTQDGINEKLEDGNKDSNDGNVQGEEDDDKTNKVKRSDSSTSKRISSLGSRRLTISSIGTHTSPSTSFSDRKKIFSENRIPARKPKNIFQLMWMALHDKILVRPFKLLKLILDTFEYCSSSITCPGILSEFPT
jgi:Ca2+-transporting ATPase